MNAMRKIKRKENKNKPHIKNKKMQNMTHEERKTKDDNREDKKGLRETEEC